MNGPQHFTLAQQLVSDARTARANDDDSAFVDQLLAEAQVHAILANTAAILHERVSDRVQSSMAWNQALEASGGAQ